MKPKIERKTVLVLGTALLLLPILGIVLLALDGCAGPPTKFERTFFQVQTNYGTPQVIVQTNIVPVTLFRTNEITVAITNTLGVTQIVTNPIVVPVISYQTNVTTVTNVPEGYVLTPGAGAKTAETVGGLVGGLFGVGGLVSTALAGLFGVWAQARSKQNYVTASTIAQNVETIRSFVKQLPNGALYDQALTTWMQNNQSQAGVITKVMDILKNEVSNADAQVAANQIQATIAALQGTNPGLTKT